MDEQALLGLNPNADARYRQRVSLDFVCVHILFQRLCSVCRLSIVDVLFYNGARLPRFEPRCCCLGDVWVFVFIHVDTMTT